MKNIKSILKRIDWFGESIGFSVQDGANSFRTWPGTVLTLLIYALVLTYGSRKFEVLLHRGDTKQTTTVQKNAFPDDSKYPASDLDFDFLFWFTYIDAGKYRFLSPEQLKQYISVKIFQKYQSVDP